MNSRLEKFAKVLFKYGKKPHSNSDPFWDNSAQIIFCACVEHLIATNNKSMAQLCYMLNSMSLKSLAASLVATKAARYLTDANRITANSILSVMTTNTKPLNLLRESARQFSLKQYFTGVKNNNPAWLFLSSAPDLREVTMPLTACLFELAISHLIAMGVNQNRRMWFIIDELASLGRLNGFATLMSEGRKYGGCVLAATQSISQLFENFGQYGASHIFGQFATKFLFRTDDSISAKIIADIFGQLEYSHQQKNTSFGANEFRDGISYTEQQRHKPLITSDDLASLADHQCFVGLPEPLVRIAKIKVPVAFNIPEKHQAFIARSVMIDPPQQRVAESDDSDIERELTIYDQIAPESEDHQLAADQHELDPILTKQAIF